MFEDGTKVRLVQPVMTGEVQDTRFNKDARELEHLVSYTDAQGETHERWFLASQLEEVKS